VVALATLAAALLHGPALGGLGIIGAYLAPMLVASEKPDYWSLYVYLVVVNAAAFALARVRLWYWLAVAALVLGALWSWPGTDPIYFSFVAAVGAHVFYVVASFTLAAIFLVANLLYGPTAAPGAMDRLSNVALSIYLLAATILVLASRHDPVALVPFIVLTAATVAIAWRTAAATAAVPVAAILATVVMAHWAVHEKLDALIAPPGVTAPAIPGPEHFDYGSHFAIAAFWAALFGIAGFLAQGRAARALVPMLWSAVAVFAPLAMLIALYYRIAALDRSLPFAGLALLLSAIYGAATEALVQREKRPGWPAARYSRLDRWPRSLSRSPLPLKKAGSPLRLRSSRPAPLGLPVNARSHCCAGSLLPSPPSWWRVSLTNRALLATRSGQRWSSIGCSMVTAFRQPHSGWAAGCCESAQMICPRALSTSLPSCFRYCW